MVADTDIRKHWDIDAPEGRADPWSIGIPGVLDRPPHRRCPLDDARGDAWAEAARGAALIGWTNSGRPVFATGTVAMKADSARGEAAGTGCPDTGPARRG
ncbi:MAG: hypothetical protein D6686_01830 [Alphaproteobacteria bacterium]|nr:MAG: hypothetical protein D6686_01830 [Alphaproteobacteria bacterium]